MKSEARHFAFIDHTFPALRPPELQSLFTNKDCLFTVLIKLFQLENIKQHALTGSRVRQQFESKNKSYSTVLKV